MITLQLGQCGNQGNENTLTLKTEWCKISVFSLCYSWI